MADKVKIIAGDIAEGDYKFIDSGSIAAKNGKAYSLVYQAVSLDLMDDKKIKALKGTAGWGFVGLALAGPLGALVGVLLGGNKRKVVFAAELKSGERFLGEMDRKTWDKVLALRFRQGK